jgi:hypothetical protein
MANVNEILSSLEEVGASVEDEIRTDIYSNLVNLYRFSVQEESEAEERIDSILAASETGEYPLEGLEENWDRHHNSFEEAIAYADAIDHLQKANSLDAFVGRIRKGFELHKGWKEDVLKMKEDPDYESPIGRDTAEDVSKETVEEVSNGYRIAIETAIEPVAENYDLI